MESATGLASVRRAHALAVVVALAVSACTVTSSGRGPRDASTTTRAPTSGVEQAHEKPSGSAAATARLDPQRRVALGLPAAGSARIAASDLPPFTPAQWADPEAVAARFVLVETNHRAGEDPAQVWARKAAYASPRFAEDLRVSSSGAAGRAELAAQDAVFAGEVLGLATVSRHDDISAVIDCTVLRTTAVTGGAPRSRLAFYRLTLVRHDDGRWLVVDMQLS